MTPRVPVALVVLPFAGALLLSACGSSTAERTADAAIHATTSPLSTIDVVQPAKTSGDGDTPITTPGSFTTAPDTRPDTSPPPTAVLTTTTTTTKTPVAPRPTVATTIERSTAQTTATTATTATTPTIATAPTTTVAVAAQGVPAITPDQVAELERMLDEIDQLLSDLEADMSQD